MAFDWFAYYQLAQELADRDDEASRRTAVSRAYYAVFCSVRNRLSSRAPAVLTHDASVHQAVWSFLGDSSSSTERQLGEDGKRLRRYRNMVDYDDEVNNLPQLVEMALARADHIMQHVPNL